MTRGSVLFIHIDTWSTCCAQILNVLFLGRGNKGFFFPDGIMGAINSPDGYDDVASGLDSFPSSPGSSVAGQVRRHVR